MNIEAKDLDISEQNHGNTRSRFPRACCLTVVLVPIAFIILMFLLAVFFTYRTKMRIEALPYYAECTQLAIEDSKLANLKDSEYSETETTASFMTSISEALELDVYRKTLCFSGVTTTGNTYYVGWLHGITLRKKTWPPTCDDVIVIAYLSESGDVIFTRVVFPAGQDPSDQYYVACGIMQDNALLCSFSGTGEGVMLDVSKKDQRVSVYSDGVCALKIDEKGTLLWNVILGRSEDNHHNAPQPVRIWEVSQDCIGILVWSPLWSPSKWSSGCDNDVVLAEDRFCAQFNIKKR